MKKSLNHLLQISSQKLQLDTKYFVSGSFWNIIQQIISVSCGLFLSYLFGHFTSKQVFGEYNLVLSYLSLLTFVSLPGLDTALVSSVSQGYEGSFVFAAKKKLFYSFIGIPVLLTIGLYYNIHKQPILGLAFILSALVYPLFNGLSNYPAFLTGKRKFRDLALINTAASLIFLTSHILGISWYNQVLSLTFAFLAGRIVPDLIGFWYASRLVNNQKIDRKLHRYGSFLTLLNILPWISGHIGSIVLASLLGVEALAVYSVSTRFLVAVQKNFIVFYKPITAKLAAQHQTEHKLTLKKHWLKLLFMGCLLAAALYFVTPLLIKFFFTAGYFEAIRYGRLISFALIPLPLTWVLSDMLIYEKKIKPQIYMSVVPQVIKIILYFLLIPRLGIIALVVILLLERYTDSLFPLWVILHNADKISK